jgi:hypothetical protein
MPFLRLRMQLVAFLVGTTLRTIGGNRGPRQPVAPLPPGPVAGARRHYLLSSLLAASAGERQTIERLGAQWGPSPAARDERRARPWACATRRDLPDVRRRSQLPARPGGAASCRSLRRSPGRRVTR